MKEIIKTQLFNLGGHSDNKKNTGKSGKLLFANMFDKTMLAENNRQGNVRKTGTKDNLLKMNVDFLEPANSFDMDKVNETFTQSPAPLLVNSQAGNFIDFEQAKKLNDLQTKTQLPEDSGLISPDFKSFNRSLLEFLRVNNDKGVHFSKSKQTEFPSKKAAAVLYAVQRIAQAHIFSGLNTKENTNYKIEGEIQGRIDVRLNNKAAGNRINIVVNSASAQRELQKYIPFIKQSLNENGLNGASLKVNVIHLPKGNADTDLQLICNNEYRYNCQDEMVKLPRFSGFRVTQQTISVPVYNNNLAGSQPPVRFSDGSAAGLKNLESNNLKKLETKAVDSIESKRMVSVDKSAKQNNKNVSDVQQLANSNFKTGISEKGEKYSEAKTSAKQSEAGNLGTHIKILDKNNKQVFNFKHADVSVTGEVKSNPKNTNYEIKTTGAEQVKKQFGDGKSVNDKGTKNFNAQIKTADSDGGKVFNAKQADASVKGEVKSNLKDTNPEIKTIGAEQVKKQSGDGKVVKDSGSKNFNAQIKTADSDGDKVFNAKQADVAVKGEVKSNLKDTNPEIKTIGAEQVKKQSGDGKVVKDSGTKNFNSQIKTADTDVGKAFNMKRADASVKGEVKSNPKNINFEIKTVGAEQVKKQSGDGKAVKDSGIKNFNTQIKTADTDGGKALNSKQADTAEKSEVKSNPKNINSEIKTVGAEQVKKQSVDGKAVKDSGIKNFNSQIKTADTDGGKTFNVKRVDASVKGEVKSNLKDTNPEIKTIGAEQVKKQSVDGKAVKDTGTKNFNAQIKTTDSDGGKVFNAKRVDASVKGEMKSNLKDTNPEIKTTGAEHVKKQSGDGKAVKDIGTKNFNSQIKTADTDGGKVFNAKRADTAVKGEMKSNLKDTNPEIKTTGTEQVKKQSGDGKAVKDVGAKNFNAQIKTADTDGGKALNVKQADAAEKGEVKSNLKDTNPEIKTTGVEQVKKQSGDGKAVKDSGIKNFNSQIKTADTDVGKAFNMKRADASVKGEVKSNLKDTNSEIKTVGAEQVKKQFGDGKAVKDIGAKNFNSQIKTADNDGGKTLNAKQADAAVKGEVKSNPKNTNSEIKTIGAEQVKKQSVDGKAVKDAGSKNFNTQIKTADNDGGKTLNAKQADAAVKGEVKSNLRDTNPEIKTIGAEQVKKQSGDGKSVNDKGTKNFNAQIKTADTNGGKALNEKQADAAVKGEVKPNLNNSSLLQDLLRYGKNHIKLDGNNHWQSALADKMGNNSTNSKRVAEKRNEIFEMKTIKSEAQELDVSLKPGRLNKVKKSVLDGRLTTSDLAGNKKVLETGIGNIQKNAPSMIEKNGFLEFGGKSLSAMQDLTLNADEPLKQGVEIKQLDTGKIMHNWLANQPVESVAPGKFAPLISNVQRVIQMQYVSNLGKQINANFKIDGSPLGEMEIKFNGDNHSGVVTIYVESESARSELQKLLPIINDGLVQKGIDLADIKIDLGNFARENSQGQKMNGNNRNLLTNKLQEDANEQITPAMTAKNYGYNTIEVLA